jgi:acylglycerol lipase
VSGAHGARRHRVAAVETHAAPVARSALEAGPPPAGGSGTRAGGGGAFLWAHVPPGAAASPPATLAAYVGAGGRVLRYAVVAPEAVIVPGAGRAPAAGTAPAAGRAPERPRHTLIYLHGIESHAAWFLPAAQRLAARGCTTFLLDRRGSGLNGALERGDAASADVLLEDVRLFRAHAAHAVHAGHAAPDADAAPEKVVIVGLSWGGKLALAAALDEPAGVRAVVLVTPGLVPAVRLSWTDRLRLLASLPAGGRARVALPITPEMFTRSPRFLAFLRDDPQRVQHVTARLLRAGLDLDRRIRAGLHALPAPVLALLAEHDRIVDNARTAALLGRLPPGRLRLSTYAGATHSLQFDDVERLVEDVAAFLGEVAC